MQVVCKYCHWAGYIKKGGRLMYIRCPECGKMRLSENVVRGVYPQTNGWKSQSINVKG